jgi:hypothetical protein
MLTNLELKQKPLVYLYNLLVADLQLKKEAAPDELNILIAGVVEALAALSGESAWFTCTGDGCDNRPFRLTAGELADAEGVVECEICSRLCERVLEEDLQQSLFR